MMRRALIALALLLLGASAAEATAVEEYARSLDGLRLLLESQQVAAAREEAARLVDVEVQASTGPFETDETLLRSVMEATGPDLRLQSRLAAAAASLRAASSTGVSSADRRMLEDLEKQQSVTPLTPGGEVFPDRMTGASLPSRIAESTARALKWIGDLLVRFYEWLGKFWPDVKRENEPTSGMRWLVGATVVLIVLVIGILAFEVIRRSGRRAAETIAASEPVASGRDADPLSRGANEWEIYAAQLAAAGRIREAIRAWYHAVLVTLYGAGILRFRKGRTNWEYVSSLAPELAWRGEFVNLTRRFEQEWYGSDRSMPEALGECRTAARQILDRVRHAEGAQ